MYGSLTDHLTQLETQRIDALLTVNTAQFDALHDNAYQLCNPTGAIWDKAEYLQWLTSGRLAYSRLETTSGIDVLVSDSLAVLRYRCPDRVACGRHRHPGPRMPAYGHLYPHRRQPVALPMLPSHRDHGHYPDSGQSIPTDARCIAEPTY